MLVHLRQELAGIPLRTADATPALPTGPAAPSPAGPGALIAEVAEALEVPNRTWPALALVLESANATGRRAASTAATSGAPGFDPSQLGDLIYILTAMAQLAASREVRTEVTKGDTDNGTSRSQYVHLHGFRRRCRFTETCGTVERADWTTWTTPWALRRSVQRPCTSSTSALSTPKRAGPLPRYVHCRARSCYAAMTPGSHHSLTRHREHPDMP